MLDLLGNLERTHANGALRAADAGAHVILMGWVNRRRDLGQLLFLDLRDRTGITQIVVDASADPALHAKASSVRSEFVLAVVGRVVKRDANTINKNLPTGEIEVAAEELRILNESKTPPFSPAEDATSAIANEEMRLKYRYLDLRRPAMQENLELRHKVALAIRNHLSAQGFFEIETPFLTRSTPEGARDYLVPSRIYPGSFYALPQSPQLFKQILMISGCEKYFQIVRCFRDEDLRADRQPEFTQIDLEMTYPRQETVFAVVEGFLKAAFAAAGVELPTPFPRMTYDEALRRYGSDKPDMRLPALADVKSAFSSDAVQTLGLDAGLPLVAVRIPKVGEVSRKERDENRELFSAKGGAKVIDDLKRLEKSWPESVAKVRAASQSAEGDLIVLVGGGARADAPPAELRKAETAVYTSAGMLRSELGRKYAARHGAFDGDAKESSSYRLTWVTDFPMFEWDEEEKRYNAAHHPFTSPHEQDMEKVLAGRDLDSVRALAYDVVLNGTELGSGSIRIHRQDVQSQIFKALGMTDEEAHARFGFFLEALEYGTPPHGGIALGLDRIVMLLAGAASLREVIPFPKTAKAVDLMVDAPTPVLQPQEDELELLAAWPRFQQKDWEFAALADELLRVAEAIFEGESFPRDTKTQLAMSLLFAKAFDDSRASIRLAKSGYGPQACVLAMQVYESALNAITVRGSEELASTLLDTVGQSANVLARSLNVDRFTGKDREVIEQARAIQPKGGWPTLEDRVNGLPGEIRSKYQAALPLSISYSDWQLSNLTSRIGEMENPEWTLSIGRSDQDVRLALRIVSDFFFDLTLAVAEFFGRPVDQLSNWQKRAIKTFSE